MIDVDTFRFANDLSIYDEAACGLLKKCAVNPDGSFIDDGGVTYSNYAYYAGPNVFRRIVGEGEIIPLSEQRFSEATSGGPMVLQYGPTLPVKH